MNRSTTFAIAVAVFGVFGWATAQAAPEDGWFHRLDDYDAQRADAERQAEKLSAELQQLDGVLDREVTDPETARRATEQMRRDVAEGLAGWDIADRRARRLAAVGDTEKAGLVRQLIAGSGPADSEQWRRNVELLVDVDRGVEYSTALMVRRGRLQVEYARVLADAERVDAEREELREQAADQADDQQLQAEIEEAIEQMHQLFDRLNPLASHDDFHREKGTLVRPVNGRPDHPFGPRRREDSFTENRHTGLTWMVDIGTPVRSTADGVVADTDRLPGYGNLVIIDHGDDHHSLYAHLDEVRVEPGDEVDTAEVIGLSGDTGSMEGPKVYFELRRQGRPIDPMPWFVR